jgi:hypothetical protein
MRIWNRNLVKPGDPGWKKMDPGSGIWDRDKHPGSATPHKKMEFYPVLRIGNVLVPKRIRICPILLLIRLRFSN